MKSIFSIFLIAVFYLPATGFAASSSISGSDQKAVLVTGASSGIGRQIALTLADHGFFVYAGARKEIDIDALSALPNIQGIRLDVTVQSEIDIAVSTVKQQGKGLYGLVNNAGIFLFDPLIEVSEQDMDFIMDVNVLGPYRVTRAFAPLLIENKGRIITTGSIAGIFSGSMMGPYGMTKHAMESFTESLASEMAKFNVQVSIVEPGNFRSNIMQNMQQRLDQLNDGKRQSLFTEELARFASFADTDRSQHMEPLPVANAVLHFMTDEQPRPRYMVAPNANEAHYTVGKALERAIELNQGQPYALSQQELIDRLTQLINQANP
ncbi:MAG: SDR family oxidoreductase [Lysobacterales bacterium]